MDSQEFSSKLQQMIINNGPPKSLFKYAEVLIAVNLFGSYKSSKKIEYQQSFDFQIHRQDLIEDLNNISKCQKYIKENDVETTIFIVVVRPHMNGIACVAEIMIPHKQQEEQLETTVLNVSICGFNQDLEELKEYIANIGSRLKKDLKITS